jgi:hypothetical protein
MYSLAELFAPILFGLLLVAAGNRALVFWQQERSGRMLFSFVTLACLCLLYLASARFWPNGARDSIRGVLLLGLIASNYYWWRDLLRFLRKKYDGELGAMPHTSTLAELGEAQRETKSASVALVATAKEEKV